MMVTAVTGYKPLKFLANHPSAEHFKQKINKTAKRKKLENKSNGDLVSLKY